MQRIFFFFHKNFLHFYTFPLYYVRINTIIYIRINTDADPFLEDFPCATSESNGIALCLTATKLVSVIVFQANNWHPNHEEMNSARRRKIAFATSEQARADRGVAF